MFTSAYLTGLLLLAGAPGAAQPPPPNPRGGFERMDQNKDGVITYEEFQAAHDRPQGRQGLRGNRRLAPPSFAPGPNDDARRPQRQARRDGRGRGAAEVIRGAIDEVLAALPAEQVAALQPRIDEAVKHALEKLGRYGQEGRRAQRGVFRDDEKGPPPPPDAGRRGPQFEDGDEPQARGQFQGRRGQVTRFDEMSPDKRADFILKRHDQNGDGVLTRDEFARRPERFDRLDLNQDGQVDRQELLEAPPGQPRGPRRGPGDEPGPP